MKISEIIERLEELREAHGDIDASYLHSVEVSDNGSGVDLDVQGISRMCKECLDE